MTMQKENIRPAMFCEADVDWTELEAIGISRAGLEASGQLAALLGGRRTEPIRLRLTMLGIEVELDAALQLLPDSPHPVLNIAGIEPAKALGARSLPADGDDATAFEVACESGSDGGASGANDFTATDPTADGVDGAPAADARR